MGWTTVYIASILVGVVVIMTFVFCLLRTPTREGETTYGENSALHRYLSVDQHLRDSDSRGYRSDSNASSLSTIMGIKAERSRRSPPERFSGSLDGKLALSLAIIEPSELTVKAPL